MSLITDTSPLNQPEQSYPFGLNLVNSTKDEAIASISSEPGFTTVVTLPANYEIIGKIYFDNKVLVFSTDNQTSQIGILDGTTYTKIYEGNLRFNKDHKILGQHRILAGCDDVFYFMDGINPDRYFNLNDIPQEPELFNIRQQAEEPNIEINVLDSGGNIPSSSLSIQVLYTNLNGDIFYTSEPSSYVPIYTDTISPSAQGSITPTSKSAEITITNLDLSYPYIKLRAIHQLENSVEVYELDNLLNISNQITFTYQGPTENDIRIDSREIQFNNTVYNTSLVSEQVQGRLLRANLKQIEEDYSGHQRLANQIVTKAIQVEIPKSEYSQDPDYYQQNLTFQSDEVYALGIRFTSENKPSTPFYHIPGREAFAEELENVTYNDQTYKRYQVENTADLNSNTNSLSYFQTNTTYPTITDCEGLPVYGDLSGQPIRHHKMPSRRNIPLDIGNNVYLIHLNFSNVTIPQGYDDYEIGYVKRTDSNSTVLDSGYLRAHAAGDEDFDDAQPNIVHYFMSPRSLLQDNIKGDYFDVQRRFMILPQSSETEEDVNGYDSVTINHQTFNLEANINTYSFYENNSYIQTKSSDLTTFNRDIINLSNSHVTNNYDVDVTNGMYIGGAGVAPDSVTNYHFYSVNKRIASVNNNLESLVYTPLQQVGNNYQGDSFLTSFYFIEILDAGPVGGDNNNRTMLATSFRNLYVESKINYPLLYGEHYTQDQGALYVASKGFEGQRLIEQEEFKLNQAYNYDYPKHYFSLPLTYDYCDRCRSVNPTRIIYSPQSFQEELSDSYLIHKTNDYIDLPANTGPITGLKYKNNRLYVHTPQTTYVLSPNPQYLTTNEDVAQLQTSDFLSIPPQQIIQSDFGYGGMTSKLASINTEYGYFWLDSLRGSLNSIQQSFTSLSNKGMISWFKNNVTTDSEIICTFDPYFHRIIYTIKNQNDCQSYHTLSYSLNKQSFTSFHSYNPDFYLNNSTRFYSTINNKIRLHEIDRNYLPSVIEQVNKSLQTKNLMSITHYTEFFENGQEVKDTFTDLIVYNSNQSTGKLNLFLAGPYDTLSYPNDQRPVVITDKNHNISNLYDNSTSQEVFEKPCNQKEYTDKVFINTDPDKSHYDKPIFREKYTIARLSYNPKRNRRMTHYLLQQNKKQSIR